MIVQTSTEDTLLMKQIFIIQQEEDVMAGATILMMLIIVHQQVDVMAGEDMFIMKVVIHTIMKDCLECKVQWNMRIFG